MNFDVSPYIVAYISQAGYQCFSVFICHPTVWNSDVSPGTVGDHCRHLTKLTELSVYIKHGDLIFLLQTDGAWVSQYATNASLQIIVILLCGILTSPLNLTLSFLLIDNI